MRDDDTLRDRYLELLVGALTHSLYGANAHLVEKPTGSRKLAKRLLVGAFERRGMALVRLAPVDERHLAAGGDWPLFGHTMLGNARLANVRSCVEDVLRSGVPGDLIEAGVWRGGTSIYMRGLLAAYGDPIRRVVVADSFEGMPAHDGRYEADRGSRAHLISEVAVSLDEVRANFSAYGLLDDRVEFVKGWFSETLPRLRGRSWAIVRLDADMYQSTMDGLENLYPDLAVGGYLIIDDYALPFCKQAVDDFRHAHGITEEIVPVDWTGIFWQKRG